MSRIWLASYPKSGNTWFRMLIAALSATPDRPLDINAPAEWTPRLSRRDIIDRATMVDSALLTHDEADALRAKTYLPALDEYEGPTPLLRFYKVHDAYVRTANGESILGHGTASGVILIVRDPRDIAPSLAAHVDRDIDWTIDYMGRSDAGLQGMEDDRGDQFRHQLLTWTAHTCSWLDQSDVPVHLVHYESLLENTPDVFAAAMRFAGRAITCEAAERAADMASFANLRNQERKRGFSGGQHRGAFFRHGRTGRWREVLTDDQARRIETEQARGMARLGYEPG